MAYSDIHSGRGLPISSQMIKPILDFVIFFTSQSVIAYILISFHIAIGVIYGVLVIIYAYLDFTTSNTQLDEVMKVVRRRLR